ncbi:MAG TPA: hypothetical protein VF190_00460 [Rhodothermales bacterium]
MAENESSDLLRALHEIRDLQRAHLEEYRRVTQQSIALQQEAVARQARFARVYRGALVGAVVLTIGIVALIVYLLSRLQPYL